METMEHPQRNSVALPPHEALVGKYVELRDELEAIEEQHKQQLAPIKEKLRTLEEFFKEDMHASNASSLKYPTGTVIRVAKTTYTAVDRSAFFDWVRATGNTDLLEGRLLQSALKEWVDKNEAMPPGIFAKSAFSVTFRRPKTAITSTEESN
jgi:hypothetical protein